MRRIALALLVVSAVAAAVAVALVRGPGPDASRASSHREAPLISNDPAADTTDLLGLAFGIWYAAAVRSPIPYLV